MMGRNIRANEMRTIAIAIGNHTCKTRSIKFSNTIFAIAAFMITLLKYIINTISHAFALSH